MPALEELGEGVSSDTLDLYAKFILQVAVREKYIAGWNYDWCH